jgi:hypothetical protein
MTAIKTNTRYVGTSFPLGILGVLFIAFKLAGVIAWPWVWVLAPFWIPLAVAAVVLVVVVIVSVVSVSIAMAKERK